MIDLLISKWTQKNTEIHTTHFKERSTQRDNQLRQLSWTQDITTAEDASHTEETTEETQTQIMTVDTTEKKWTIHTLEDTLTQPMTNVIATTTIQDLKEIKSQFIIQLSQEKNEKN